MKKINLLIGLLILMVLVSGCITKVEVEEKNDTPKDGEETFKIDTKIIEELKSKNEVKVIITFKEINNIENIILKLDETEFKLEHKGSGWVSGKITRKGLDNLKNNPDVLKIYKPLEGGLVE